MSQGTVSVATTGPEGLVDQDPGNLFVEYKTILQPVVPTGRDRGLGKEAEG